MPKGKVFNQSIKSQLPLQQVYDLCLKACNDSKLKMEEYVLKDPVFSIKAQEPMKWISTNWPCHVEINGSPFQDSILIQVSAFSKMASMTQDANTNNFLTNLVSNIKVLIE